MAVSTAQFINRKYFNMIKFTNDRSYIQFEEIDDEGDVMIEIYDDYNGLWFYWPLNKQDCHNLIEFLQKQTEK